MNAIGIPKKMSGRLAGLVASALLLAACAGTPETPSGAVQARQELKRLQSDPALGALAPDAIKDAEIAVAAAETPDRTAEVTAHRVYIAQRKVEIARALAEARLAENQRATIVAERDKARLEARTAEADAARVDAAAAKQLAAELQREIDALHAQSTDRGLVLTLGDVLFSTGRADLKPGTIADLTPLVTFLNKYPERTVTIEGHTDSVGSEDLNLGLSQRRADAVRSYLMQQGIDGSRITAKGMGESVPVASNDSEGGRQQNRRVEVIVSNSPMAQR
jgi:outer membrane protein OmpA-like peptidoglycan-associated protein